MGRQVLDLYFVIFFTCWHLASDWVMIYVEDCGWEYDICMNIYSVIDPHYSGSIDWLISTWCDSRGVGPCRIIQQTWVWKIWALDSSLLIWGLAILYVPPYSINTYFNRPLGCTKLQRWLMIAQPTMLDLWKSSSMIRGLGSVYLTIYDPYIHG